MEIMILNLNNNIGLIIIILHIKCINIIILTINDPNFTTENHTIEILIDENNKMYHQ